MTLVSFRRTWLEGTTACFSFSTGDTPHGTPSQPHPAGNVVYSCKQRPSYDSFLFFSFKAYPVLLYTFRLSSARCALFFLVSPVQARANRHGQDLQGSAASVADVESGEVSVVTSQPLPFSSPQERKLFYDQAYDVRTFFFFLNHFVHEYVRHSIVTLMPSHS